MKALLIVEQPTEDPLGHFEERRHNAKLFLCVGDGMNVPYFYCYMGVLRRLKIFSPSSTFVEWNHSL